ncbi:hypothetical protein J3E69DRAFT_322514 [Trichoderma sp. SZMC 28015]
MDNLVPPEIVQVTTEIGIPKLPSSVTTASLGSAAWALLLSRLTGKNGIVFP